MLQQQEMILGPLLPGRYCLEVGTLELLLSLSPGANLTLWVNVEQGQYRWRQDRFHCAWNQG